MDFLKYKDVVLRAFDRLGFEPRANQMEAVCQIIFAFIDEKMTSVVLNAPTGAGKSIIGAVAAETLTTVKGGSDLAIKSSISLTATNVLAKQYGTTFQKLANGGKYIMIKGANNYDCTALNTPEEPANAESCAFYTMTQNYSEFESVIESHCNTCEYLAVKKKKNAIRHLTTNYSYFFVDRMYTGQFEDRDLVVWDEAHLINDLFSEHNAIYFSQKSVQKMAQEIADTVQLTDIEIAKILQSIGKDLGIKNKINDTNYETYLNALIKIYRFAKEKGTILQERALKNGNIGAYKKLTSFVRSYDGRLCKIDDFFKYGYDHVFEFKEEEKSVSVKPVFVGTMFEALHAAPRNLFMSATISDEMLITTLKLPISETRFIKLPSTFPKEHKEVVFFDPMSLNYTSMQNPDTIKRLVDNVKKIVVKHTGEYEERGIILAPSFKLAQAIAAGLPKTGFRLFEQRQGEKLENILTAFKAYSGGPAVLLSPSVFEGIDLPGDLSRFQIMVKAPFPSLADKRMKFILDHYPSLYNTLTIMKMVQGFGRSVRSPEDFAVTYILDMNGQRLFNSKQNVWKDEFLLRYSKFV